MSKKSLERRIDGILLSKWFSYFLFAVFLAILYYVIWVFAYSYSNDFALRFNPTLIGLIINFAIFIVFFDIRDYLEWRTVSDKVKRRIGDQLHSILWDVNLLVDAEIDTTMNDIKEEDFKKLTETRLNALSSGKFVITNIWKDKKVNSNFINLFQMKENMLAEIESRYGKFLKSDIQCSLMNVEEYLHRLSWEFALIGMLDNYKPKISDLAQKIGQEIDYLNRNGIAVP